MLTKFYAFDSHNVMNVTKFQEGHDIYVDQRYRRDRRDRTYRVKQERQQSQGIDRRDR